MRNSIRVLTCAALCAGRLMQPASGANAQQGAEDQQGLTNRQLIKLAKEVEKDVEQLRGWKFKHPVKTDVYTERQLRGFIEKRIFEEQLGEGRLEQCRLGGSCSEDIVSGDEFVFALLDLDHVSELHVLARLPTS